MRSCTSSRPAVSDVGFQWRGKSAETGAAATFYAFARTGKLSAMKAQFEQCKTNFSSDSAQNLLRSKTAVHLSDLLNYQQPQTGLTPLMAAVVHGHYAVAHQLVEYGASVHATCGKGRTALHHLVKEGDILNVKLLNLLLDSGASPFCADSKGFTALDYALQRRSLTSLRVPGVFEQTLQSLLNHSICSGPAEVKVKRALGLGTTWARQHCAVVPFQAAAEEPASALHLLVIDEQSLSLVEKAVVMECRSVSDSDGTKQGIQLTTERQGRRQAGCLHGGGCQEGVHCLRGLSGKPERNAVVLKLQELALQHPEPEQRLLHRTSCGQAAPTNKLSSPDRRKKSCKWSFRDRQHSAKGAGFGCALASSHMTASDRIQAGAVPEEGICNSPRLSAESTSRAPAVLDSADSLFDALTFHLAGI